MTVQLIYFPATRRFIEEHDVVQEWLSNRAEATQHRYGTALKNFCHSMNITPKQFLRLSRKNAVALVWKYLTTSQTVTYKYKGKNGTSIERPQQTVYIKDKPASARIIRYALTSFYRSRHGESLPFDSSKGGKHYICKKYTRILEEHIPNKEQFYKICDMATTLRDRALWLVAFQSGCRLNVFQHLTFGMVKPLLYPQPQIPLMLKITEDIDSKLQDRQIPFFYTFAHEEAVNALKAYCDKFHQDSDDDTPLFYARHYGDRGKRFMQKCSLLKNFKNAVERAGFNPRGFTFHTLRKACRKVLYHSRLEGDYGEFRMGHRLKGSRQSYFDMSDANFFRQQEDLIDFTRHGSKNLAIRELREQLQQRDAEIEALRENGTAKTDAIKNLQQEFAELKSYTMNLSQAMLGSKLAKKLPLTENEILKDEEETET